MYERLNRIDGLRALAILGVIAIHAGMLKISGNDWLLATGLPNWGKFGVQLFFLISGFILCYVADNTKFTNSGFFIKRFFRLAPMFYLILIGCYLIGYNNPLEAGTNNMPLDSKNFLLHLTFLHGLFPDYLRSIFAVMWSLTPEVVFYMFFPFLFRLSTRTLVILLVISGLLSKFCIPISEFLFSDSSQTIRIWAELSPVGNMIFFIFGMLVYRHPDFFSNRVVQLISFSAVILFLISSFYRPGRDFMILFYNYNFGIVFFAFPFLVYNRHKLINFIFENKFSAFLGKISYSAFFIHIIVINILADYNLKFNYSLGLLVVLLLTMVISYLTFTYIEKPGINAGKKFIKIYENFKFKLEEGKLKKA